MDYDKDFEEGFETTSLGKLHYLHHKGPKERIIFLNGVGASTKVWKKLVQYLPDDLDIWLLDMLGHGKSDAPKVDYTVKTQFFVLNEFISQKTLLGCYIFGNSYGGWVAAYYASQQCECKGIILEDCAGLSDDRDEVINRGDVNEYKKAILAAALKIGNNKEYVFRNLVDFMFSEDNLTPDVLYKISVPAKIIWGSDDGSINVKFAQVFKDRIQGSSLTIIEGGGHVPHFNKPKEVSDTIIEFIREKHVWPIS